MKKISVEREREREREKRIESRVEAGSNTSTVALRVVGGDEKEILESHGTETRELLRWRGPAAIASEGPPSHQTERLTSTNPQLSDSNKNLVARHRLAD
jgi:hypothetical protein